MAGRGLHLLLAYLFPECGHRHCQPPIAPFHPPTALSTDGFNLLHVQMNDNLVGGSVKLAAMQSRTQQGTT